MSEYIVGLEELGRASVSEAGGKGALLGELLARGVPVPRGFCLTTLAYEDFLQISGVGDDSAAVDAMPPGQEAQDAAAAIHDRMREAVIPAEVAFNLSTLYRSLGQRPRVAVRTSLAYKDHLRSPITSHIEAHLNVSGEKDLFQAVRDTWASIWQPEVIAFCNRTGINHSQVKPAVIMQVMVHPVCSGTIFTADPGTGDRDRLVITAAWGMGQGSLGGQATPDTYHVDRVTLELRYKRIVTKEVMVSATGIVPVPKNRRNSVVLKDPAIQELCKMALNVEEIIEEPAEIEWCALTNGQVMVLETLPVGEIDVPGDEVSTVAAVVPSTVSDAAPAEPAADTTPAAEPTMDTEDAASDGETTDAGADNNGPGAASETEEDEDRRPEPTLVQVESPPPTAPEADPSAVEETPDPPS